MKNLYQLVHEKINEFIPDNIVGSPKKRESLVNQCITSTFADLSERYKELRDGKEVGDDYLEDDDFTRALHDVSARYVKAYLGVAGCTIPDYISLTWRTSPGTVVQEPSTDHSDSQEHTAPDSSDADNDLQFPFDDDDQLPRP